MYRFFVDPSACGGETIRITGNDVNHMKNVLRLRRGEEVVVSNGENREYVCEIKEYTDSEAILCIVDVLGTHTELPTAITLYQGFPKTGKWEWIIQKAVELGAVRIVPVMTKRSVVKLDDHKAAKKVERYNAIACQAAKQSQRGVIPTVERVMSFTEALEDARQLDMTIIPYEEATDMIHAKQVIRQIYGKRTLGIFIGPEGGFEEQEVRAAQAIGAESITLGKRILRTETAGLTALSIIMFELESHA